MESSSHGYLYCRFLTLPGKAFRAWQTVGQTPPVSSGTKSLPRLQPGDVFFAEGNLENGIFALAHQFTLICV